MLNLLWILWSAPNIANFSLDIAYRHDGSYYFLCGKLVSEIGHVSASVPLLPPAAPESGAHGWMDANDAPRHVRGWLWHPALPSVAPGIVQDRYNAHYLHPGCCLTIGIDGAALWRPMDVMSYSIDSFSFHPPIDDDPLASETLSVVSEGVAQINVYRLKEESCVILSVSYDCCGIAMRAFKDFARRFPSTGFASYRLELIFGDQLTDQFFATEEIWVELLADMVLGEL